VRPRVLNVRPVYKGWATISIATIEGEKGQIFERLMEDHGGGVCVLPIDRERKVATLVRQFRAPVCVTSGKTDLLECPAGLVDNQAAEVAVRREAIEETGLHLNELDLVATVWTMPGISTERMHLLLAAYSAKDRKGVGGGHASEHEYIVIEEVSLAELGSMADDGRIEDMKTLLLIQTIRLREPELFSEAEP
jgi:nudix-type nucleoside diphosphatase (YffH/AdpP family)